LRLRPVTMAAILCSTYALNASGSKLVQIGLDAADFMPAVWIYKQGFPKLQMSLEEYNNLMDSQEKINTFFTNAKAPVYSDSLFISDTLQLRFKDGAYTKCVIFERLGKEPHGPRIIALNSVWMAETTWRSFFVLANLLDHQTGHRVRWCAPTRSIFDSIVMELQAKHADDVQRLNNHSELLALLGKLKFPYHDLEDELNQRPENAFDPVACYYEMIVQCAEKLFKASRAV